MKVQVVCTENPDHRWLVNAGDTVPQALPQERQTLHEAIKARGWTSRKENDVQRRTIYDGKGECLGSFTAAEAWEFLREQ